LKYQENVSKDRASHPLKTLLLSNSTVRNCIKSFCSFKFESEAAATAALHRLHQLDVLGYPLTVEYARGVSEDDCGLVQSPEWVY
jgi:hypothetical protein